MGARKTFRDSKILRPPFQVYGLKLPPVLYFFRIEVTDIFRNLSIDIERAIRAFQGSLKELVARAFRFLQGRKALDCYLGWPYLWGSLSNVALQLAEQK